MLALSHNIPLLSSIMAMVFAQFIKPLLSWINTRKFDLSLMWSSGGMPSSHSALVTALATSYGLLDGFSSSSFTISTVVALVVMYDAIGIRRQAGIHASVLNHVIAKLTFEKTPKLNELLGHKPIEVLGGVLVGIGIAGLLTHRIQLENHFVAVSLGTIIVVFRYILLSKTKVQTPEQENKNFQQPFPEK